MPQRRGRTEKRRSWRGILDARDVCGGSLGSSEVRLARTRSAVRASSSRGGKHRATTLGRNGCPGKLDEPDRDRRGASRVNLRHHSAATVRARSKVSRAINLRGALAFAELQGVRHVIAPIVVHFWRHFGRLDQISSQFPEGLDFETHDVTPEAFAVAAIGFEVF